VIPGAGPLRGAGDRVIGSILGSVAAVTDTVEIACKAYLRHGVLRTDKLLADHGRNKPMPELLRLLAGDCPRLSATNLMSAATFTRPPSTSCSAPTEAALSDSPRRDQEGSDSCHSAFAAAFASPGVPD
jgi:hypothetical protein